MGPIPAHSGSEGGDAQIFLCVSATCRSLGGSVKSLQARDKAFPQPTDIHYPAACCPDRIHPGSLTAGNAIAPTLISPLVTRAVAVNHPPDPVSERKGIFRRPFGRQNVQ